MPLVTRDIEGILDRNWYSFQRARFAVVQALFRTASPKPLPPRA